MSSPWILVQRAPQWVLSEWYAYHSCQKLNINYEYININVGCNRRTFLFEGITSKQDEYIYIYIYILQYNTHRNAIKLLEATTSILLESFTAFSMLAEKFLPSYESRKHAEQCMVMRVWKVSYSWFADSTAIVASIKEDKRSQINWKVLEIKHLKVKKQRSKWSSMAKITLFSMIKLQQTTHHRFWGTVLFATNNAD